MAKQSNLPIEREILRALGLNPERIIKATIYMEVGKALLIEVLEYVDPLQVNWKELATSKKRYHVVEVQNGETIQSPR